VEEQADGILSFWKACKDISLEELRLARAEIDFTISVTGLYWFPECPIFIYETWIATNMTRSHGHCPRG
jgi:hypothetical protein